MSVLLRTRAQLTTILRDIVNVTFGLALVALGAFFVGWTFGWVHVGYCAVAGCR